MARLAYLNQIPSRWPVDIWQPCVFRIDHVAESHLSRLSEEVIGHHAIEPIVVDHPVDLFNPGDPGARVHGTSAAGNHEKVVTKILVTCSPSLSGPRA